MNIVFLEPHEFVIAKDPGNIPWPESSTVVVALDGEKYVGRAGIIPLYHIEGTWVDEQYRQGTTAFRLVDALEKALVENGNTSIFAYIPQEEKELEEYMGRMGYKRFPVSVWSKELTCQ